MSPDAGVLTAYASQDRPDEPGHEEDCAEGSGSGEIDPVPLAEYPSQYGEYRAGREGAPATMLRVAAT